VVIGAEETAEDGVINPAVHVDKAEFVHVLVAGKTAVYPTPAASL
jgi:hypothetical protein